jgi:hypothetical protein
VQLEARNVHIIRPTAAVQYRKNVAKFFNMCRRYPSCRPPILTAARLEILLFRSILTSQ